MGYVNRKYSKQITGDFFLDFSKGIDLDQINEFTSEADIVPFYDYSYAIESNALVLPFNRQE